MNSEAFLFSLMEVHIENLLKVPRSHVWAPKRKPYQNIQYF